MRRLAFVSVIALSAVVLASHAGAGSMADFEKSLREAYGDYRVALFQTNAGDAEKSAKAISSFQMKWQTLADPDRAAPPQYADDGHYAETLSAVDQIAGKAAQEVGAGKLTEAHEVLEAIRDEIGGLHERNGIVGYSDRMNAYHAKMEEVLGRDYSGFDAAGLGILREDAGVLAYLAATVADHPPAEAADPAYKPLLEAFTASTAALLKAAREGDAQAAKTALGGLKPAYSKLFLKFG